jgi:tetratricopeptide (TPR) repeat protein
VQLREVLWQANPERVDIGDGLAATLTNLGALLRGMGQGTAAEAAYRRAVQLREVLWQANPEQVEIKIGYAGSLCAVGRFAEARPLVNDVLALIPDHPDANQLQRYLATIKRSWWTRLFTRWWP